MNQLSVIMPVYNQEKFVAEAVKSILNQTFTDFEFIIVDDGSTDKTLEILKGFKDSRIKIFEENHNGFLKVLNKSLSLASGKWGARMDSDDVSHPQRLEKQIEFLKAHPECNFVGTTYGIITPNNNYLSPKKTNEWRYLTAEDITYANCLFADPSVLFDRARAVEIGYDSRWENEKPLWYKLLKVGKGAVMEYPYHFARWTWGSHSRSKFQERYIADQKIRINYDSDFIADDTDFQTRDDARFTIKAGKKCIYYYLAADDYKAAREVTLKLIQKYPFHARVWRLAIRSFGRINSDVKEQIANSKFSFSKADSLW